MDHYYPRLLLNETICKQNIATMATKARMTNVIFRPHFKTHQSDVVAQWFKDEGVKAITVSSAKMATYFAAAGWTDIFIAFPVNLLEIKAINRLASQIELSVSVESEHSARHLAMHLDSKVGVYIKIDTGYHRTGLELSDMAVIEKILAVLDASGKMTFRGFYTHSGHTYSARNTAEITSIFGDARDQLGELHARFSAQYPDLVLSVGDTPSCSLMTDFDGLDEIRPGNFVFYDLMQHRLGACMIDQIAVALECPVVAKNSRRNELLIHGGAVHLSKEAMIYEGEKTYGLVAPIVQSGWGSPLENTFLASLSQEHGIIRADHRTFNSIRVGDTLAILPVHSCLTANLADHYLTPDGHTLTKMRS